MHAAIFLLYLALRLFSYLRVEENTLEAVGARTNAIWTIASVADAAATAFALHIYRASLWNLQTALAKHTIDNINWHASVF